MDFRLSRPEVLDASKRMANPLSVEYAVTPPLRHSA